MLTAEYIEHYFLKKRQETLPEIEYIVQAL